MDGLAPMVSEVVGDSVTLADKEPVEEVEGLLPADKRAVGEREVLGENDAVDEVDAVTALVSVGLEEEEMLEV